MTHPPGYGCLNHFFVGGRHAGDRMLWNQKGADSGSFLFAGMARSYSRISFAGMARSYSRLGGFAGMARSYIRFEL